MTGFEINIIYSEKVKNTTLEVWPGSVLKVTAPVGLSEIEIKRFISKKAKWIVEQNRLVADLKLPKKIELVSGEAIPFFDKEYRLKIISGVGDATLKDDRLIVPVKVDLEEAELKIIAWYKEASLAKIENRVRFYCEKMGTDFKQLKIIDSEKYWGTCTPDKVLSFNWKIALLPKTLFNYVIAHEVCHLLELNHGVEFKRSLAKLSFSSTEEERCLRYYSNWFFTNDTFHMDSN